MRRDLLIAPVGEAGLILTVSLVAWAVHQPLIFASLGPTAYELAETPSRRSSRPYNVIAGHTLGVAAGFLSLWLTGTYDAPAVTLQSVSLHRIEAAVLAAMLTVFATLVARAAQPAAAAISLLIALGQMRTWKSGVIIMTGVLLMTAFGEPLRRWRLRSAPPDQMSHARNG